MPKYPSKDKAGARARKAGSKRYGPKRTPKSPAKPAPKARPVRAIGFRPGQDAGDR